MRWLFPRVRQGPPLRKLLRFVRGLLRERRALPVPPRPAPSADARRAAAEAVGLTRISGRSVVNGRLGELDVFLGDRARRPGTRVEIRGLSASVALTVEGMESAMQKRMGVAEMEVGDDAFDRALFVRGDSTDVRALLDAEVRRLLLRAFRGRLRDDSRWAEAPPVVASLAIAGGTLVAELEAADPASDPLDASLRGLLEIARRLARPQRPAEIAARLARNATEDPEPGVRLRNLRALVREHAGEAETARVLTAAADDESQEVRLEAAVARGADGRKSLLALAAEGWTDDAVAARALDALGPHLPPDRARPVLEHALGAAKHATAAACLRALGRGGPDAVPLLWENAAHARAEIALAAIGGLAEAGTIADVPRLRALEQSAPRASAAAARQAIASIQSRAAGASPGQLALSADGAEGRVSVAGGPAGRVSLEPREP